MKKLTLTLVAIAVLEMTAPSLARSLGSGGGGAGHFGGMHGDGVGNPAGGGGIGRGGTGSLNPAGPFNRVAPFDRDGMRDHDRGFRGRHRFEGFGFPACSAYAYCPSPVWPCEWRDGYWTAQPYFDEYGDEMLAYAWVPAGCY